MEGTGCKPMSPSLTKEPRQASLNMYVLCVHLSSRQTPMSLDKLGPLRPRLPCQNGWLVRPLRSRKGISQLGIPNVRHKSEFSRPRPPTPALGTYISGQGRQRQTPIQRVHSGHSSGSPWALTGRDTLIEMHTDVNAVPHASLSEKPQKPGQVKYGVPNLSKPTRPPTPNRHIQSDNAHLPMKSRCKGWKSCSS